MASSGTSFVLDIIFCRRKLSAPHSLSIAFTKFFVRQSLMCSGGIIFLRFDQRLRQNYVRAQLQSLPRWPLPLDIILVVCLAATLAHEAQILRAPFLQTQDEANYLEIPRNQLNMVLLAECRQQATHTVVCLISAQSASRIELNLLPLLITTAVRHLTDEPMNIEQSSRGSVIIHTHGSRQTAGMQYYIEYS